MVPRVFAEDIFDAADDDGQFQQLSVKFARAFDARSAVLHWRLPDNEQEQEISYSGHFSSDDMAKFEKDFERDDLWAMAIRRPGALNHVWNLDALVPRERYENGRLYNEWIRPIGDDTMHALGAAIRTPEIDFELAVHRGRTQTPFDAEAAVQLSRYLPAVRRMLLVRRKLLAGRNEAAVNALDQVGHASFTLGVNRQVLHMNRLAAAMVEQGALLKVRHGRLLAVAAADEARLSAALVRATAAMPESGAVLLGGPDGRYHSASLIPVWSGGARKLILIVNDPQRRDPSVERRLRAIYGLSQAEAEVAARLADGLSPNEIAGQRATSVGTIRSQLKAIAGKMGVGRQSQIVRAVLGLPKLAP